MAIYDQEIQKQRRDRCVQLIRQGLTTRQIADRLGMTTRSVLRIKKEELENARGEQAP